MLNLSMIEQKQIIGGKVYIAYVYRSNGSKITHSFTDLSAAMAWVEDNDLGYGGGVQD